MKSVIFTPDYRSISQLGKVLEANNLGWPGVSKVTSDNLGLSFYKLDFSNIFWQLYSTNKMWAIWNLKDFFKHIRRVNLDFMLTADMTNLLRYDKRYWSLENLVQGRSMYVQVKYKMQNEITKGLQCIL